MLLYDKWFCFQLKANIVNIIQQIFYYLCKNYMKKYYATNQWI